MFLQARRKDKMAAVYKSVTELIGKTPLFEAVNLEKELGLKARILLKLEYFNPAGSVKDRVALNMIEEAERAGKIGPGAVIIEPTSGNTGIGLAAVAASRGYRAVFVMPETMSIERRKLLLGYGGGDRAHRREKGHGRRYRKSCGDGEGTGKCHCARTVCE